MTGLRPSSVKDVGWVIIQRNQALGIGSCIWEKSSSNPELQVKIVAFLPKENRSLQRSWFYRSLHYPAVLSVFPSESVVSIYRQCLPMEDPLTQVSFCIASETCNKPKVRNMVFQTAWEILGSRLKPISSTMAVSGMLPGSMQKHQKTFDKGMPNESLGQFVVCESSQTLEVCTTILIHRNFFQAEVRHGYSLPDWCTSVGSPSHYTMKASSFWAWQLMDLEYISYSSTLRNFAANFWTWKNQHWRTDISLFDVYPPDHQVEVKHQHGHRILPSFNKCLPFERKNCVRQSPPVIHSPSILEYSPSLQFIKFTSLTAREKSIQRS